MSLELGQKEADELNASLAITSDPQLIRELRALYNTDRTDEGKSFQYASALAHSSEVSDKKEAASLFLHLVDSPVYSREAFYNLSVIFYGLKDYDQALQYCEELYRREPDNTQVRHLHKAIVFKHKRRIKRQQEQEAAIGVAVGAGIAAAAIGIGFLLSSGRRK